MSSLIPFLLIGYILYQGIFNLTLTIIKKDFEKSFRKHLKIQPEASTNQSWENGEIRDN